MACLHPILLNSNTGSRSVPCGRCLNCLKSTRNSWVVRLTEELKASACAYFVTLTYDDAHLLIASQKGRSFGVLNPLDPPLFLKRLRKNLFLYANDIKLRFFLNSEYGPRTFRPHYHLILFFNSFISESYVSQFVKKSWNKGFITVSSVNSARIAYVAKYVNSVTDLPAYLKPYRPFRRMSRGIGRSYLTPEKILYHQSGCGEGSSTPVNTLYTTKEGYSYALPRYYRDRIYTNLQKAYLSAYYKKVHSQKLEDFQRNEEQFSEYLNYLLNERLYSNYHSYYFRHIKESIQNTLSENERLTKYLCSITKTALL